ncbi:lipid A biosynthesis acyltransferase [Flavobacterium sp. JP2137]|uniref:LpxL/LpxP family acyltransferase n=1 Tax=Flavobacterium sp. JP2137 TaxID=3414510 RepID=UPI003D2FACC9
MSQWDGKSKGTLLGYKIFVFCIKKLGIRTAYAVLIFVSLYYFLFSKTSNRYLWYYLNSRLRYSAIKSFWSMYKSYFSFGKILIDKTAISAGLRHKFTYDFDGIHILRDLVAQKKGGVLISAHVGNFEIAEYFLADLEFDSPINLVTTDQEHSHIKAYLNSVSQRSSIKFIIVQDDLSHIFEINNALNNNELICFTGDRYFEGSKVMSEELLGKKALFPSGPFLIASRLQVPVVFVYVMKEPRLHYHLYARQATAKHRDAQALLKEYCHSVEDILKKYPLQWFNYFDFWKYKG